MRKMFVLSVYVRGFLPLGFSATEQRTIACVVITTICFLDFAFVYIAISKSDSNKISSYFVVDW